MKTVLTYILLLATMLPSISPWGTIAYYRVNKEYIARVLCENRNRPERHCDGQCYLAKKLKAQQDKQDKETTERVQHVAFIQLFCESGLRVAFEPGLQLMPESCSAFSYLATVRAGLLNALFRPPRP